MDIFSLSLRIFDKSEKDSRPVQYLLLIEMTGQSKRPSHATDAEANLMHLTYRCCFLFSSVGGGGMSGTK
jgi:hypothetical protein